MADHTDAERAKLHAFKAQHMLEKIDAAASTDLDVAVYAQYGTVGAICAVAHALLAHHYSQKNP